MHAHRMIAGLVATAVVAPLFAAAAAAQTDNATLMRTSAYNQLGILEYCQSRGHADSAAIAGQKTVISRLPASSASFDKAEALGRSGTIAGMMGNKDVPLSDMASKGNTTEASLCQQMAANVTRMAASPSAGTMPGVPNMPNGMPMPTMPNGMTMPTMPNGMTMPNMPNGMAMPTMPNGAPAVPPPR